jgi:hypothetical protein
VATGVLLEAVSRRVARRPVTRPVAAVTRPVAAVTRLVAAVAATRPVAAPLPVTRPVVVRLLVTRPVAVAIHRKVVRPVAVTHRKVVRPVAAIRLKAVRLGIRRKVVRATRQARTRRRSPPKSRTH